MIEDKAGWGLVPGLQALLLHIHTTAAAQWAAPTTAGLGWAGCAGARRHSAARRAEESHSPRTSLGSQARSASEPQALGIEEFWCDCHGNILQDERRPHPLILLCLCI
ncbi:guanine nucleotide-binding protein G(I)/G(S)/G(O) subunit gamma-2 isoform X3 [Bubalus kerabau]|uniref:guanine nucleotide-binding protein G(I)/G(S)/G(O) subunit gamma-2 isoform X3 n=1 Tax=Bubalus carabanensis TaxID=3119969 RepID=UPI00244EA906|nr:guanine nucleotide-binding protein G(I)/G(S)/G(O) subunit gamma-2 isoform X3 [Bubalus carabanensis]